MDNNPNYWRKSTIEAFEMRVWSRIEKISWVDKVINAEVLQKVQENWSRHLKHGTTTKTLTDLAHFEA